MLVLSPAAPPQKLATTGTFDYVTVDALHRRVYAAHGGANTLLVVDADRGKVLREIKVGPMHGVAYDAKTDRVFVGIGEDQHAVSEVDPTTYRVTRTVDVPGHVDAIAYDPELHRIYADEDDGTRVFVVDSKTFKHIGTIAIPGHKPEYLQIDPANHAIYQNISDAHEIVVIDAQTLKVTKTIPTPELTENHPLQYDPAFHALYVAGENGLLSVYSPSGKRLQTMRYPTRVDQCDLDVTRSLLACGRGKITLMKLGASTKPTIVAQIDVAPGMKTLAVDQKTGDIWVVWSDTGAHGAAYVQRFTYKK